MNTSRKSNQGYWTLFFAILFLSPSLFGFGMKLIEFFRTFASEASGRFAITPMANYLLASLGFLCLLIWAAWNGMFTDLEGPKTTMLLNEHRLDAAASTDFDPSSLTPRSKVP